MADFLSKLLFDMHVSQSSQQNSPFPYKVEFDYTKLNIDKFNHVNMNENNLKDFAKICFDEFIKKNPDLPKGSVHMDHVIWTKFALKTIFDTFCSKTNSIYFSNGCCSRNNCPINIYYLIVLENIMLND
jgi:hypothetical protein